MELGRNASQIPNGMQMEDNIHAIQGICE